MAPRVTGSSSSGGLVDFYQRWKYVILGVLGGIAAVLGIIGWLQTVPGIPFDTAVYLTIQLFTLEFDHGPVPSLTLNIARFLAAAVLSLAVATVIISLVGQHLAATRASRMKGHAVIVGNGPEAVRLAANYRAGGEVTGAVIVGELAAADAALLRKRRVAYLPAVSDGAFARVLAAAKRVVVTAETDDAAAGLARRVRSTPTADGIRTTVLFTDRDLTSHWNRAAKESALCRPTQLATALLREAPPFLEHAMVPPPIVVGAGPLATEIAHRIVTGWQQPGERLRVYCVGDDREWMDAAAVGIEDRADFEWVQTVPHAGAAARAVLALTARWDAPDPAKFDSKGPRVYVAYPDGADTVPIAAAIAEHGGRSRVVGVVDDDETWHETIVDDTRAELVSALALLTDPATITMSREQLLAAELVADAGRWPLDVPGVLGDIVRADDHVARRDDQPAVTRAATDAIARDIKAILGRGGITLESGLAVVEPALVLSPDELTAVADELAEVLRAADGAALDASEEGRLRRLEFAARLPTLAARTGSVPTRTDRTESPFTAEALRAAALEVHNDYLRTAVATGNATGSANAEKTWDELSEVDQRSNIAQVLDIPVKLAALGLTWRRTPDPRAREFTDDQVEEIARLEHRRWAHFQIRNGRARHTFNVEWAGLPDGVREYDRGPVRLMTRLLAENGFEIVEMAEQSSPVGDASGIG